MSGPKTYRKRPVDVEAIRHDGTAESVTAICGWVRDHGGQAYAAGGVVASDTDYALQIDTLEGMMLARPGDWIIRGVQGEFYPCKPDIFAETYEEPARAMVANEHATEPREPESLFPPRVRALVKAILASRDVLPEGGRIEMLPHPSREVVVKVEIGAVLPVDVVRGIETFEMVAPPPPLMVNVGTYLDPDREERVETVHLSRGAGVTACCRRTLFELPRDERTTTDPMGVTCEGPR